MKTVKTVLKNLIVLLVFALPAGIVAGSILGWAIGEREGFSREEAGDLFMWWLVLSMPVLLVGVLHHVVMFLASKGYRKPLRRTVVLLLALGCSAVLIFLGDIGTALEPEFLFALSTGGLVYGLLAQSPLVIRRDQ